MKKNSQTNSKFKILELGLFLTFVVASSAALAAPNRIQSVIIDKGKVSKISMVPGLGSIVLFPCPIGEAFVGREAEVTVKVSPTNSRNLLLSLKSSASDPTNMVVKCERGRNYFVFDIVPSRRTHQDLIEIRSSFGGPRVEGGDVEIVDSSDLRNGAAVNKPTLPIRKRKQVISVEEPTLISDDQSSSISTLKIDRKKIGP